MKLSSNLLIIYTILFVCFGIVGNTLFRMFYFFIPPFLDILLILLWIVIPYFIAKILIKKNNAKNKSSENVEKDEKNRDEKIFSMYHVLIFVVLGLFMFHISNPHFLHGMMFFDNIFDEDILLIIIGVVGGYFFFKYKNKKNKLSDSEEKK